MERVKTVMEILDKMNFFQGQRAGRELWNDKPFEVQEEDLGNFKRDIDTIGSYIWEIVKELKQYRDAEEQGLLLRLPCPIGTTVYFVEKRCNADSAACYGGCEKCADYSISSTIFDFDMISHVGNFYFLTKEEAEQALARMKEV